MPANPNSKLRVTQAGVEVFGPAQTTGKLRVTQEGVEAFGPFSSAASHLRVTQEGVEVWGIWTLNGLLRVTQQGVEAFGPVAPPRPLQGSGRLHTTQQGVEVFGLLRLPPPAGDNLGYDYYTGPGFSQKVVTKNKPPSFQPYELPIQPLQFLEALKGFEVTAVGNVISGVPLTGNTGLQVTFPSQFAQACYWVGATYVPTAQDTNPIIVGYQITNVTPQGFTIIGVVLNGTAGQATGSFTWGAIGI